jgi:hypothetical protein
MKRRILVAFVGVAFALGALAGASWADGPEIEVNAGAVVPLGDYKNSVNTGGSISFAGGWRMNVWENAGISLLAQPKVILLGVTDCPPTATGVGCESSGDISSTFAFGAGPKFWIQDGRLEWFAKALGGYYRDMSGPLAEKGAGVDLTGGVHYLLNPHASVGLYAGYEHQLLRPTRNSDSDHRSLFQAGLGFTYRFVAREEVRREEIKAVTPPPPPPPPPPPVKKKQ